VRLEVKVFTNKSLLLASGSCYDGTTSAPPNQHTSAHEVAKNVNQELTDRQTRILDYIRYVTRMRNYPPSVREIGEAVGLSSSSTVHNHLNQLERRGLIRRDPSKSRTVQLVEVLQNEERQRDAVAVPVIGHVAAGAPILAEQNIEDHVVLSPQFAKDGWFALRVRGDSMVNAGILNGDLVLVKPQQDAPDGSIVVALVGDEATVKRLDRSGGRLRLLAENPAYDPIEPSEATMVGLVQGLLRTF
jgi:repressor LexA